MLMTGSSWTSHGTRNGTTLASSTSHLTDAGKRGLDLQPGDKVKVDMKGTAFNPKIMVRDHKALPLFVLTGTRRTLQTLSSGWGAYLCFSLANINFTFLQARRLLAAPRLFKRKTSRGSSLF